MVRGGDGYIYTVTLYTLYRRLPNPRERSERALPPPSHYTQLITSRSNYVADLWAIEVHRLGAGRN